MLSPLPAPFLKLAQCKLCLQLLFIFLLGLIDDRLKTTMNVHLVTYFGTVYLTATFPIELLSLLCYSFWVRSYFLNIR